jgi:hypothetical protein
MNHSPYPVVLDACVIYPNMLRDLLMEVGKSGLYPQQNTSLVEESASAAASLREQADLLMQSVSVFSRSDHSSSAVKTALVAPVTMRSKETTLEENWTTF